MRRVLITVFIVLLMLVFSSCTNYNDFDNAKRIAEKYEKNIIDAVLGGYWEAPMGSDEIEPDEPMGIYRNEVITNELVDKYRTYLYILDNASYLDAQYSYDDVESAQLTSEELLNLSDVTFNYYYNFRKKELIQSYTIKWVNTAITSGYVVWKNNSVIGYWRY